MSDFYNAIERTNANGGGTEYGNTKEGGGGGGSSVITIGNSTNDLTNAPVVIMYGSSTISTTNKIGDQVAVSTLGVYTIICGVYSADVTVTALGGIFNADVTTTDSWKLWVEAGGLDPDDYDDLAEVLADEEAVRRLMTIHASVDFLANDNKNTTLISTIINDNYCAKWINLRDYALDTLYANEDIAELMDTADKYFYGEWALVGQVPKMTSNTAPYGEAGCTFTTPSGYEAYKAFDGNDSTYCSPQTGGVVGTLYYKFTYPVCVKKIRVKLGNPITSGAVVGSNDGTNWTEIQSVTVPTETMVDIDVNNSTYYLYYGIRRNDTTGGYSTYTLQFYAWGPKGNVPVMTSNTAPYGEAFASIATSGFAAYKAYDGDDSTYWDTSSGQVGRSIGYKFSNPVCVKKVFIRAYWGNGGGNHAMLKAFDIKASNDGTNYVTLGSYTYQDIADAQRFSIDNDSYYFYYNIVSTSATYLNGGTGTDYAVNTLQFYGRELKVSVPTMTSDTAPYGEASASSVYNSDCAAWKAFDKQITSGHNWHSGPNETDYSWVAYDFGMEVKCLMGIFYPQINTGNTYVKDYTIEASNDGFVNDINTVCTGVGANSQTYQTFNIDTQGRSYKQYRMKITSSYYSTASKSLFVLDFYGLDYSEYDWDTEHQRHYIYDHGVELEEIKNTATAETTYTKASDYILLTNGGFYPDPIDLSSYSLIRQRMGHQYVENANGSINITTTSGSVISYNKYQGQEGNFPNNLYLNVSSVSDTVQVRTYITSPGKIEVTEWWLE